VVALGLADHESRKLSWRRAKPRHRPFQHPAVAYVLATGLMKGDMVEITLINDDRALLSNSETLADDKATFLLQAGKRGVPAGGWPEGSYRAALKIMRDARP